MAKQLGALPRVLQDRHDTLRMTMQVNDADGDGTNDDGDYRMLTIVYIVDD